MAQEINGYLKAEIFLSVTTIITLMIQPVKPQIHFHVIPQILTEII